MICQPLKVIFELMDIPAIPIWLPYRGLPIYYAEITREDISRSLSKMAYIGHQQYQRHKNFRAKESSAAIY